MSVLGIIAEYNPFHNGHKYHIDRSKELCGADSVVCVMSGNFIQRGEPAIVDKWARTEMALLSGADLVIELPVVYAMSSAEFFAYGAVKILDSIGITDFICFGSEAGGMEELDLIADILTSEPESYKTVLKNFLSKGLSYPAARENALAAYLEAIGHPADKLTEIIKSSNNILGIEYLKALKRLGSRIRPQTIKRIANTYNSQALEGAISSATAIRMHILSAEDSKSPHTLNVKSSSVIQDSMASLASVLPRPSFDILQREIKAGRGPVFSSDFENTILSALRQRSTEEISSLPYIGEGLENRIKAAAGTSGSLEELIDKICTRRYTRTRIQRCLFSTLTGLKHKELSEFNLYGGPQYIRVLGFNNTGRRLLSRIIKNTSLPVIVKTADFKKSCNPFLARMLEIEAAATDQYVLAYANPEFKKSGQEFTRNIVRFCGM